MTRRQILSYCPWVVDLRVGSGSDNADFHCLLEARLAGGESAVGVIGIVPLYGIADVVAEHGYLRHFATFSFSARCSTGRGESPAVHPSP